MANTGTKTESDLLTFAQRKQHYESDKSYRKELFTSDTRPHSVRVLYEEAGKVTPPPTPATGLSAASTAVGSPTTTPFDILSADGSNEATLLGEDPTASNGGANLLTAGSDDDLFVCSFGNSKRKMRKRIDAEIEIRLPAAIEDLRKWTSSEALGDVTVTPDCMHHVDTSISTSVVIGDNGVLTPALSPSVLSADAVDALYSIDHNNTLIDNSHIPNDINNDVPLNHRLPSPEEQCKIIALRYPAEVISVDTSGKRFQRMCMARKSTTGVFTTMPDTNNLNDDVQTVARRSRSRKARGKRRNTIAGIDQKEIQNAANGDTTATCGELKNALASTEDGNGDSAEQQQRSRGHDLKASKTKFGRSKSSDLLKKESVALPYDKGKSTLTRLNSLKQWGRNRFKFMQRSASGSDQQNTSMLSTINSSGCGASNDLNISTSTSGASSQHNTSSEKADICSASGSASVSSHKTSSTAATKVAGEKSSVTDVDDECRVHEYVTQRAHESRFSHERKPSYSSSEKSMSVSSSGHLRGKLHLNSACANVKLRDTSSLNRQRRINGLGGGNNKDDQPHSSSGNWSASSESGRASIGSEITLQPKSSASNTSLNVSSFQNGSSNPPSSMLSRRRFFNTSASSSVTSEGTATPDLQMANEGTYPNHLDDETSSAYSCDTEGYYTSFHMDSGLRTLKEEEINMSNFQIGGHPLNASIFGQQQQQQQQQQQLGGFNSSPQTLMAENEYELFGRGSTSTTTSSAGTVCTALMAHNSGTEQSSLNNSLASCGPEVPERVSSLRLSSASTSTLERSISSSTIGSTLERTGTIKRNVNASLKLSCNEEVPSSLESNTETPESQDDEFNFNEQIKKRGALPLPCHSSEVEVSECSDLEGVERIERIKQKTAMTARRIPSMCIITPSTSDDENHHLEDFNRERHHADDDDDGEDDDILNKTLTEESFKDLLDEEKEKEKLLEVDNNLNHVKAPENLSLFEKLKVILPPPTVKKSPKKAFPTPPELSVINDDELYDMSGEYVYISADVSNNNNKKASGPAMLPKACGSSSLGIYYSNKVLRMPPPATEYVSLNELPKTIQKAYAKESSASSVLAAHNNSHKRATAQQEGSLQESENKQRSAMCAESDKANNSMSLPGGGNDDAAQCPPPPMPMYAEINELRSEIAASASSAANATTLSYLQNTPPSSASSSPHVSPHKGARVRLNAQGKPIYDSDSLKRRKGAHTTFAPGPYVKRQPDFEYIDSGGEYSAINQGNGENESADADATLRNTSSVSVNSSSAKSESVLNPVAKLLLLNKSNANPRKIANVRPIIQQQQQQQKSGLLSPSMRPLPLTPHEQQQENNTAAINSEMYNSSSTAAAYAAIYSDAASNTTNTASAKQFTANQTNPYFHHQQSSMMHSPSTKSTASSTGSTISSSTASSTSAVSGVSLSTTTTTNSGSGVGGGSGTVSSSKDDEGYQHLYKRPDELDNGMIQPYYETLSQRENPTSAVPASTFQRNSPLYWTLQNRRPVKPQAPVNALSRDDLYATPLKRSERLALAQKQQQLQQQQQQANAQQASTADLPSSPSAVRQRNINNFQTSTPIRNSDSSLPADNIPAKQRLRNWDDNSPERLNTCADRIGQSKTSLMDFKRLLLAKSAKSSTLPKKMSAVELLKKNNLTNQQNSSPLSPHKPSATSSNPISITGGGNSQLNSSMKLLDLSGSPKTFANRRMLRQGQFGSPSKSFAPKLKTTRSNSLQRTDIMSTTIPEANSEEDHHSSSANSSLNTSKNSEEENIIDDECFNIKRNIFLQAEENNFMRNELRSSFGRSKVVDGNNKQPIVSKVEPIMKPLTDSSSNVAAGGGVGMGISTLTSMMANVNIANPAVGGGDHVRLPPSGVASPNAHTTAASLANMPALETAL
ncbi:NHS actin remodeling regulator GUK-holder isoform X2 [Musca autumnalis]|uniref:NHS actin remodeling regulator GUK-holder isoform X2 n=1 Tax=Musca autumnalis TaxID=221902 RepID=UPI003CFA9775